MFRRKKLIWFEQGSAVGGADESRQRGAAQTASPAATAAPAASSTGRAVDAYYGPVTLDAAGGGAASSGAGDGPGRQAR